MEYIIAIMGVLLGITVYIIINLLKKYNKVQDNYIKMIDNIYYHLKNIHNKREEIDKHNYFEYDENMQYVYVELGKLIDELNTEYNKHV